MCAWVDQAARLLQFFQSLQNGLIWEIQPSGLACFTARLRVSFPNTKTDLQIGSPETLSVARPRARSFLSKPFEAARSPP